MDIIVAKETRWAVVSIKGRIDAMTSASFASRLEELVDKGENAVLLNLAALEYISSNGLRCILKIAKRLHSKGGEMLFAGLQDPVAQVFELSGFGSIFRVYPTVADAAKHPASPSQPHSPA
ncbi:MAG: STAS domain-containing protein [Elusimicrobia bacterium]|nr:STAS domain-containing protein [Elusimicrobiota bacterium]